MPHLRHDPHTDGLLDALARPWTPRTHDERQCPGYARHVARGALKGLVSGVLVLVVLWCWL